MGRGAKRVSEKGEGVRRKGIACSQSQIFYRTLFAHEQGAIVQLDWLTAPSPHPPAPYFLHSPTVLLPSRSFLETPATEASLL